MNIIVIGNIISLMASAIMVLANYAKDKKNIIKLQTIQVGLFILCNLVLNGITGVIINTANLVRNILCY